MTETKEKAVLQFLSHEHAGIKRNTAVNDLGRIGRVSPQLPELPPWEWHETIDELIHEGRVSEHDDLLRIVRLDVSFSEPKEKQETLF